MTRSILCLDFDGVIHSFTSGWRGARNIPDPPVPGALEFILAAQAQFTVAILSSRSHQWGGRRAMRRWLAKHVAQRIMREGDNDPFFLLALDAAAKTIEPFETIAREQAVKFVRSIQWPIFKPPAMITIDDRALNFNGEWPPLDDLQSFKPWYHK